MSAAAAMVVAVVDVGGSIISICRLVWRLIVCNNNNIEIECTECELVMKTTILFLK